MEHVQSDGIISGAEARRIWRDLAWLLGNRFIMIIGYGDESYGRTKTGGYVIAGWFADRQDWEKFAGHWQNALNEKHAPYLHMRELDGAEREKPEARFHGWSDDRVRDFVDGMIPIITGHAIFGLSCAIDAARREELPEILQRQYKSSYALAFQLFFEQTIKVLCNESKFKCLIPQQEKVALVFDQVDKRVGIEAHKAFSDLKLVKADGNRFGTLTFADSKPEGLLIDQHCLGLQAADLLANRGFKTYKREIDRGDIDSTKGWDIALKARGNLLSTYIGKSEIEDFAERARRREESEKKPPTS